MSGDFTEVSSVNWFQRLSQSIVSVLVGILLFGISFIVLFWNEGRAVQTARGLEEGASSVVSLPGTQVEAANDGKLVHVTGEATTADKLTDPEFGVSVTAIRLSRKVEMYQYQETSKTEKKKKLGGGEESVTTYSYTPEWSSKLIDSAAFKDPEYKGKNPTAMKFSDKTESAKKVTLGGFELPERLTDKMKSDPLSVDTAMKDALPTPLKDELKVSDGKYFVGVDASKPVIGDTRVGFTVVKPATVSIIAKQNKSTFEPFQPKEGPEIMMLSEGTKSAQEMFTAAQAANTFMTWVLRAVGFIMMAIGISMMFKPLVVMADVIPIFGDLLSWGVGIFAFFIAVPLSLITIAIGWIVYRPLLGIGLLVVAGAVIFAAVKMFRKPKAVKTA